MSKRILFLFALSFILSYSSALGFAGGTGTSGDPYQITTPAELASISSYLGSGNSGVYFELMNDIDLNVSPYNSGSGWTPLGTSSSYFYGHFDGGGHTISNLYISRSGTYQGLFGEAQDIFMMLVSPMLILPSLGRPGLHILVGLLDTTLAISTTVIRQEQ